MPPVETFVTVGFSEVAVAGFIKQKSPINMMGPSQLILCCPSLIDVIIRTIKCNRGL
ncbi:MAG: hypothetical protein KCHDKBKB_00090 [Elusimicrobia bacterium]|nr:hypothetical protein [Elusimicrobiota bacterium]